MSAEPLPDLSSVRGFVLDFDGVILESTEIKEAAFRQLFAAYPAQLPAIVRHHRENLGISRYEKFRWIYDNLLEKPLSLDQLRQLGARFSELVSDRIRDCPLVPGAFDFLRALDGRRPAFIASGTPQDELQAIVRDRGLERYFEGVWGSPRTKEEILESLLTSRGWSPGHLLMIGDGTSDHEAAKATGVLFVARGTADGEANWAALRVASVRDLREMLTVIGTTQ